MNIKNVWITHHSLKLYGHSNLTLRMVIYLVLNFFLILREKDNVKEKEKRIFKREKGRERERKIWSGGADKKERDVVAVLQFVLTNLHGKEKKLLLFIINAAKKYNLLSV